LGRYVEAEPLLNKALAIWRELLGPNDVVVAIGLNNVADIYAAYGRYEDARRSRVHALKIDQAALGPASPLVANDWNNLGVVYAQQHKLSAAADALNKAIEIGSSFTPPHPRLVEFMGNLAALMTISNPADEGERLHARVLSMQVRERGSNQPSVGFTLTHIAECEIKLKKYASAAGHAIEAVGILRARLGDYHPRVASAYFALAMAYEKLKRADLAEPALQNMMEIDRQATLEPSVRSSHLREYALVLREEGKKDEAKALDDMATEVEEQDPEHVLSHGIVDVKELAR
jgi:Tfp pilus assembly protein PilF